MKIFFSITNSIYQMSTSKKRCNSLPVAIHVRISSSVLVISTISDDDCISFKSVLFCFSAFSDPFTMGSVTQRGRVRRPKYSITKSVVSAFRMFFVKSYPWKQFFFKGRIVHLCGITLYNCFGESTKERRALAKSIEFCVCLYFFRGGHSWNSFCYQTFEQIRVDLLAVVNRAVGLLFRNNGSQRTRQNIFFFLQ